LGSRVRTPIACGFALGLVLHAGFTYAGDVTTDNLTVYRTATVFEQLTVQKQVAKGSMSSDALSLYFPFGTDGGGVAVDASGNSNTGTVNGATFTSPGRVEGGAYQFDGVNDYLRVKDHSSLNPTTQLTLGCWFKTAGNCAGKRLMAKYFDGTTRDYDLHLDSDSTIRMQFAVNNAHVAIDSDVVAVLGQWYQVTVTFSSGTARIYVDGVLKKTASVGSPLNNSNEDLHIGCVSSAGSRSSYFNGTIDQVFVYSRALSSAEVTDLYLYNGTDFPTPTVDIAASAVFRDSVVFSNQVGSAMAQGDISMGIYTNRP
jgi:hypothetical protein